MKVQEAYAVWSKIYDTNENFTRDLDQMVTKKILGSYNFSEIVEAGCGTGKNTLLFADISKKVQAMDFSEEMLAMAAQKINKDHVIFQKADLTMKWPVETGSADLISCNLVLEHIKKLDHIFEEASRILKQNGYFFISELHPFRQYAGKQARFEKDGKMEEVDAYIHNISDFIHSAEKNNLVMRKLDEWWNTEKEDEPPRLISFLFTKQH